LNPETVRPASYGLSVLDTADPLPKAEVLAAGDCLPTADPLPEPILGSLSPSRAADFKACPLLYRFRAIDRIPEPPSRVAVRGTLVHKVLEALFALPAADRVVAAAHQLVDTVWSQLQAAEPDLAALFADSADLGQWLQSARDLLDSYFALEDPSRLGSVEREQLVEVVVDGLRLRGYVDRIDSSRSGDIRIIDYKTGTTPRQPFEAKALFQMKFYALVIWRTRGIVPRQLRLIYLADQDTLTYRPDEAELVAFERTLKAIWAAIARASERREFRPSPSRMCEWCDHKSRCPSFGGTPPPYPDRAPADAGEPVAVAVGLPDSSAASSLTVIPTSEARTVLVGASGIGTSLGIASTAQPADSADATPVGESSIATQVCGAAPSNDAART
jgi:putative RecB family exonuclease